MVVADPYKDAQATYGLPSTGRSQMENNSRNKAKGSLMGNVGGGATNVTK